MLSGYDLRRHLEHAHQQPTRGWAYGDMAALHLKLHEDPDILPADHAHDGPADG